MRLVFLSLQYNFSHQNYAPYSIPKSKQLKKKSIKITYLLILCQDEPNILGSLVKSDYLYHSSTLLACTINVSENRINSIINIEPFIHGGCR